MLYQISRILLIALSLILMVSCGSGPDPDTGEQLTEEEQRKKKAQEDYADIEQLLGIESDAEKPDASQGKQKDDELMGLLGVEEKPKNLNEKSKSNNLRPSENDGSMQSQQPKTNNNQRGMNTQESNKLKNQIIVKEKEINRLRDQLQEKELVIANMKKSGGSGTRSVVISDIDDAEFESVYQQGLDLFNSRQYPAAIEVFERLLGSNDDHKLAVNAQYWIGESHYMQGKYNEAILDFEKVFSFKGENKKDHAQFKLGRCYLGLKNNQRAKEEFERFLNYYPKSDLRSKAQQILNGL
jgi:TolA-binding protein